MKLENTFTYILSKIKLFPSPKGAAKLFDFEPTEHEIIL